MEITRWKIARFEAEAEHGMVAAKHPVAAEAGLQVLKSGGNAVDAAITTAFVMGVLEPYMSGIGGGGFMLFHKASTGENHAIDFFMSAPRAARPDMYQLAESARTDLLGFRGVRDEANYYGYRSIGVPGMVAGAALALQQFGTISLGEALQPAIQLAEEGFEASWLQMLYTGMYMEAISRFPPTAEIFLKDGKFLHRTGNDSTPAERLIQRDLAAVMRRIAEKGPEGFYSGAIAQTIAQDIQAHGGIIDQVDLATYGARLIKPRIASFREEYQLAFAPSTGGSTLAETLKILEGFDLKGHDPCDAHVLHLFIEAARIAYADRWQHLADESVVEVPWGTLESDRYAEHRRQSISHQRAAEKVKAWQGGVFVPGEPESSGGCTTHLSVVDQDHNMVAITQTVNEVWGSRVVVPGTGVLFNDAMILFDPNPGRANSIAAGKRPLSSMTPILVLKKGKPFLSLGAQGGRQIMGAVMRVLHNVTEFGMGIQDACATLSFDASAEKVLVDADLDASVLQALRSRGHRLDVRNKSFFPRLFASPTGILIDTQTGQLHGGADPYRLGIALGY